jgi:monofunctional biosynthetic peptidoglycan transglycosylase
VVKAEDPRFFTHRGIDWREMVQVLRRRLRGGALRGLSTITQQLARNLFLSPRRALSRKALEGVIALRLERAFDKLRILEIYLNVVEWGDGVWGIEAASRHYFDRSPAELDAFESAFLAALLPAPRRPLQGWFARRARGSFHYVFFQLKEEGFATQPDFEGALARMDGLLAATTRGVRTRDALEALARFAPRRIPAHGGSPSLHEVVERLRR